jgi:hypothetical protein
MFHAQFELIAQSAASAVQIAQAPWYHLWCADFKSAALSCAKTPWPRELHHAWQRFISQQCLSVPTGLLLRFWQPFHTFLN